MADQRNNMVSVLARRIGGRAARVAGLVNVQVCTMAVREGPAGGKPRIGRAKQRVERIAQRSDLAHA